MNKLFDRVGGSLVSDAPTENIVGAIPRFPRSRSDARSPVEGWWPRNPPSGFAPTSPKF
jgi:hypothetical protein